MEHIVGDRDGCRLLAFIMAVILVLGALPVPVLNVWARTAEWQEELGAVENKESSPQAGDGTGKPSVSDGDGGEDVLPEIENIEIRTLEAIYEKGAEQKLVTDIQGIEDGDEVSYSTDGIDWKKDIPVAENAGNYSVYVKISRDGYQVYESGELNAVIEKDDIEGIIIAGYHGDYDGEAHPAITIEGLEAGDKVTCTYNGQDTTFTYLDSDSISVPEFVNAGQYVVTVKIERNSNYNVYGQIFEAKINAAAIEGITASLKKNLKYNGEPQELVEKIEGTEDGDIVYYSVSSGDSEWDWTEWTDARKPEAVNAGEYEVRIKVVRANYHDKEVELNPATVTIEKAGQELKFVRNNLEEVVELDQNPGSIHNVYDFTAEGGSLTSPVITYRVENASDDGKDISEIAEIVESGDDAGTLTVLGAGNINIMAAVAGDDNYEEGSVSCHLTITVSGNDLISFEETALDYVIGDTAAIANQAAIRKYGDDDTGEITYFGEVTASGEGLSEAGIRLDSASGEVSVGNLAVLSDAIEAAGGSLSITIHAEKGNGTKTAWGEEKVVYGECETSYTINITTEKLSSDVAAYTLKDENGNPVMENENGWYNTAVRVIPAEGYSVARDKVTADYGDSVVFGEAVDGAVQDQGQAERIIYLKNNATGKITAPITITVDKLDNVKPYMDSIQFPRLPNVLGGDGIKYYGREITITFTAYDETSGVESFEWAYDRSEGASSSILESYGGILPAVRDSADPTKYTAELTLPEKTAEQLRGNLSVSVNDAAGNSSDILTDDGVFIVDTISPVLKVNYTMVEEGGHYQKVGSRHYFSEAVIFTVDIVEANFYPEDVEITIARDGEEGVPVEELDWVENPGWKQTGNRDEYEATLTLSRDGAYVVEISYADRSANDRLKTDSPETEKPEQGAVYWSSDVMVVDTIAPQITFEYHDFNAELDVEKQTATVIVREQNFRKDDIEVAASAQTITGESVQINDLQTYLRNCEWTSGEGNGDIYTALIPADLFVDAIYELTINYSDLALNSVQQQTTASFTVDHTPPATETMEISYSEPLHSTVDTILSTITFGYYNPTVTVTFIAHDNTAGVDYFTWEYAKENGASAGNVEKYDSALLAAVQDAEDKTRFTASVTLPKEQAEQLRGSIAFTATDRWKNTSDKLTDSRNVIIVDTISPTMTVAYTEPDNSFENKAYYNDSITATFTVTEANFYSGDVEVRVSRDNGEAMEITPVWVDVSSDVHVGTYTIDASADHSTDGDYVFSVSYTDRSNNTMSAYTSDILVLDTTMPVIQVTYENQDPVNTLADSEGNERKYFANTQTATITITEHNFNPEEVKYTIIATNAAGGELDADSLHSKSPWVSDGDVHVLTVSFPGSANYTFSIAYTDLAMLAAVESTAEYFTVDTITPSELAVSYSTSVLETILSTITFGFYNAKMTVTVTATDDIAGVYSFKYGYLNAEGVSAVNAQLEEDILEMGSISYSDDGITATGTFEIPRQELATNNQFNGVVTFNATDRSGNISDSMQDNKRIVVDSIAPTADVQYNEPVQTLDNVAYYDGDINVAVTINEANFYSEDVVVSVAKDGNAYTVTPVWTDNSTDVHVGTFTLTEEGDYLVDIAYTDKSGNVMQQYTSGQMTIDTSILEAVITINGEEADGKAFKEDVVPAVSFEDVNFQSYEIRLTRTRYGNKDVDVTDQFITGHISTDPTGGSGIFDTFEKVQDNDGIYTLTVTLNDKAAHTVEKSVTFTVNRYGSVYEYSDYLVSLIQNGGAYVQQIGENLIITEYNADRLVDGYLNIEISRDGKPLEKSEYMVTPEINRTVAAGSSGWYQYQYTIDKDNFNMDGVYKISISSMDATGNTPENSNYEDKGILFRVDSTPPEIDSITGLEERIINATSVEVKYSVYDTIGLESVVVYVDGSESERITDFSEDMSRYSGSLTLAESPSAQTIRLVVKDLAGNVTDTNSDSFSSAYAFNRSVTVSTNAFVRWFANRQLFWGSIVGAGTAAVGTGLLILLFRHGKAAKTAKTAEK